MKWYLKVLKQYFDFNGRARRKEYWMFFLFNSIIATIIRNVFGLIGSPEYSFAKIIINPQMELSMDFSLSSIYSLAVLIPSIAVGVRRMHDVGKSGWFILIPIYNFILAVSNGEDGENKYGPNPKQENDLFIFR